jgi:hypothetical protein
MMARRRHRQDLWLRFTFAPAGKLAIAEQHSYDENPHQHESDGEHRGNKRERHGGDPLCGRAVATDLQAAHSVHLTSALHALEPIPNQSGQGDFKFGRRRGSSTDGSVDPPSSPAPCPNSKSPLSPPRSV